MAFDYDGTLCLGDDPVLTYAQFVNDALVARGSVGTIRAVVQRGLSAENLVVDNTPA